MLEKTLESPLDCKEIQPVHPKDQSWVFIGRTDAEAETTVLWPPQARCWLIGKDPDAGRDWGQEEKGTTRDEMVGWHHRLDGRGFELSPRVGDGHGGLACWDSWGCKESETTEWLNWTELILDAEKVALCTGVEFNLRIKVLGEVWRNNFTALPGKEGHSRLMPSKTISQTGRIRQEVLPQWFKGRVTDNYQSVFWVCIPLFWSQVVSWLVYMVRKVIELWPFLQNEGCFIKQLTYFICWCFNSTEKLKDIVLCLPWGKIWICSKATLLILDSFSLVSSYPSFPDWQLVWTCNLGFR